MCRKKEGEGVAEKAAEAGVRRIEFLSFQSGLRPAVWRRDIRGLRRLMGAADIQVLHAHRGQDHWLAAATLRLGGGGRGGGKKEIGRPPRSSAPGTSSNPSGRIRPTAGSITGPRTGWSRRPKKSGRGLSARARSGPHGIITLRGGVDARDFRPGLNGRADREKFGIPDSDVVFGMNSSFIRLKGHMTALEALARLRRRGLPARILPACAGGDQEKVARRAAEMGIGDAVHLLGFRSDLPTALSAADAGLFAARSSEGTSRAVLEWMALGKPVVATDVGCVRELLRDGTEGLIVPPENPAALADAMERLVRNPERRRDMGRSARDRAEREYDRGAWTGRMVGVYRRALGLPAEPAGGAPPEGMEGADPPAARAGEGGGGGERPMTAILGITDSHCATAALLIDGRVVACVSEERFTRKKNEGGYPRRAVEYCLGFLPEGADAPDAVALAGREAMDPEWFDRITRDESYIDDYFEVPRSPGDWRPPPFSPSGRRRRALRRKRPLSPDERISSVAAHVGVPASSIQPVEHHRCHAAAAYYASPFAGGDAFILTNDNAGDGLCASVSRATREGIRRLSASRSAHGSLGSFYSLVTVFLGMRQLEHEQKVMGMAPYAPAHGREEVQRIFREMLEYVPAGTGEGARFRWRVRKRRFAHMMMKLARMRFDWVAAAAQDHLENLLEAWTRESLRLAAGTGGNGRAAPGRVALSGGIFMNVKANQVLARLPEIGELFVMPSCGDESNAIGAAYQAHYGKGGGEAEGGRPGRRVPPAGPPLPGTGVFFPGDRGGPPPGGGLGPPRGFPARRHGGPGGRADRSGRGRRADGGADGVRRARPGEPVHPGRSPRLPGRGPHQQNDQEPGFLDALRPDRPGRGRGSLPSATGRRGPVVTLHDAGLRHDRGGAGGPGGGRSSLRRHRPAPDPA